MALSRVGGDDELYIGGLSNLRDKSLSSTGITHIVSVLSYHFKDIEDLDRYDHLIIDADDVDDENLLGEFERTGSWIETALREGKNGRAGKVLVHCQAGMSRSVTITIAYILRQYPHHTVSSALSLIRETRAFADPNHGFIQQLELYKEMGCPRDIDAHPKYQRWLYQAEVDLALAAGMAPDKLRFEDEEKQEEKNTGVKEVELRCRKCRRTLATTQYLIDHVPPQPKPTPISNTGPISSLTPTLPPPPVACTHHFLHPLSWMRPELEQGLLNGRLECPNAKCGAQIGRYAWQGIRCSCGVWVCPGFSLQKGRVDEVVKRGESVRGDESAGGGGGGIRLPPGMKGKENL